MGSTHKISEQDLLKSFDEIQEQINQLMEKYSIDRKKKPTRDVDSAPVVAEPIFSYEIHASS